MSHYLKLQQLNLYSVTYTYERAGRRLKAQVFVSHHSTRKACDVVRLHGWGDNKLNIRAKLVSSLGYVTT